MFGFGHHHSQAAPPSSGPNQIFKVFCRASDDYVLAVRDGAVVLTPINPKDETQVSSINPSLNFSSISLAWIYDMDVLNVILGLDFAVWQHWLKDMRFSTSIKDEEGMPAFALVNKATGLAVKHSIGQSHPVSLLLLPQSIFEFFLDNNRS